MLMARTTLGAAVVLASVLASGCAGADDPRAAESTAPTKSQSEVGSTHRVPDDFPIDVGLAEPGWQVFAPTHANTGQMPMDICGDFDWEMPLDRLHAGRTTDTSGGEGRTLYLFGSPELARDELGRLRSQAKGCPSQVFTDRGGETTTVRMRPFADALPSGADGVTLEQVFDAEHATAWLAVRRGPAILVLSGSVDGSEASEEVRALLTRNAATFYPELCVFPDAGC